MGGGDRRVREAESAGIGGITTRSHASTEATPELCVSYTAAAVVRLDLNREPVEAVAAYGRDRLALNSDDDFEDGWAWRPASGAPGN